MEAYARIKEVVNTLKEVVGQECASCVVKVEWDEEALKYKGQIEFNRAFGCGKFMDFLRDVFPYITMIIIASIVGCRFGGCTSIEDKNKITSDVQVHNIEACASVHIKKEAGK